MTLHAVLSVPLISISPYKGRNLACFLEHLTSFGLQTCNY